MARMATTTTTATEVSTTAMMRRENRMLFQIVRTLTPFRDAIRTLSEERYPTVGLTFPIIRRVRADLLLRQQEQQEEEEEEEEEREQPKIGNSLKS